MSRSRPEPSPGKAVGRLARQATLLGSILALGACQSPVPPSAARMAAIFRMQSIAASATQVATDSLSPAATTGPAAVPSPGGGSLVVRFDAFLADVGAAPRKLLARAADVDRVTIRLAGPGVDRQELVTAAMLAAGTTSVTFVGLPFVDVSVALEAFDPGGRLLGRNVRKSTVLPHAAVTVVAGAATAGEAPPGLPGRQPGAGSGGSGGSGGAGGSGAALGTGGTATPLPVVPALTAGVTIIDGQPARDLVPRASRIAGFYGDDVASLAVATDASAWVVTGPPADQGGADGALYRIGPDGSTTEVPRPDAFEATTEARRLRTQRGTGRIHVLAGAGHSPTQLLEYEGDGTLLIAYELGYQSMADFVFDAEQRLVFGYDTQAWFGDLMAMGGEFIPAADLGGSATVLAVEDAVGGDCWILGSASGGGWIRLANAEHQLTVDRPFIGPVPLDIQADDRGRLWYVDGDQHTITCLAKTGVAESTTTVASGVNRLHIDADGNVWGYQGAPAGRDPAGISEGPAAASGGTHDLVVRLDPSGTALAYYHLGVGVDLLELAVASNGKLWAGTGLSGLLEYDVDVPFAP